MAAPANTKCRIRRQPGAWPVNCAPDNNPKTQNAAPPRFTAGALRGIIDPTQNTKRKGATHGSVFLCADLRQRTAHKEQCIGQSHTVAPHFVLGAICVQAVMPRDQLVHPLKNGFLCPLSFNGAVGGIYAPPKSGGLLRHIRRELFDFAPAVREPLQPAALNRHKAAHNVVRRHTLHGKFVCP